MTPEETRRLAFEKARQNALRKFGSHVLSQQVVSSRETRQGLEELTTERVAVLAAGNARLVEGSKEIQRRPTEETVVYKARAKFEISPTDFQETLRAYLSVGSGSDLRRRVQTAVSAQSRLSTLDPERTEPGEVRKLLSETTQAYKQVTATAQSLDGQEARDKLARQRTRRQNALLRYLRAVRKHGHPHDLLDFSMPRREMQDEGSTVAFDIKLTARLTRSSAREVLRACRETRPIWAPDDARDSGVVGRPATDGWLQEVFGGRYTNFELSRPLLLYLLDENDGVLAIIAKTSGGTTSPPQLTFNYGRCAADGFFTRRLPFEQWEFEVPTRYLKDVANVMPLVSRHDYAEVAERNGYAQSERGIWVPRGGEADIREFRFPRARLEKALDGYRDRVMSMGPVSK